MAKEIRDVLIIGGGAAGLFAAVLLSRKGLSVTVLEHTKTVGKKLSVTGNGRCNYTNFNQSPSFYRSGDLKKAYEILSGFDANAVTDFFSSIGIEPNIRKGRNFDHAEAAYVYPASGSAKDVVTALSDALSEKKVKVKTDIFVHRLTKDEERGIFLVETGKEDFYTYEAKEVLVAVGGLAAPSTGSDGSFYRVLKELRHSIKKPLPALTSLIGDGKLLKELSGIRIEGALSLFKKEPQGFLKVAAEQGELQFSERGISGIPAMQLSGLAARLLDEGEELFLYIDFFREMAEAEVERLLFRRKEALKTRDSSKFFLGFLPEKLSAVIKKACFPKAGSVAELQEKELKKACHLLKEFQIKIDAVGDFSQAQTTTGGVPLSEVSEFMESLFVKGLYFAGEVLDVDGLCGGYNLTWAWAGAYRACEKIGE